MSARKVTSSTSVTENLTIQGREARLTLSEDSVLIRRGGIEFRSPTAFAPWTEMTVALRARDNGEVNCSGVVVACTGSKHAGFNVSMVFTSMSKQAEARISAMAEPAF
ncbi:MAG: hypothetical protein RLY20_2518 [Verrucomicrobiota bacterium]|jgi:hypothetical protein